MKYSVFHSSLRLRKRDCQSRSRTGSRTEQIGKGMMDDMTESGLLIFLGIILLLVVIVVVVAVTASVAGTAAAIVDDESSEE